MVSTTRSRASNRGCLTAVKAESIEQSQICFSTPKKAPRVICEDEEFTDAEHFQIGFTTPKAQPAFSEDEEIADAFDSPKEDAEEVSVGSISASASAYESIRLQRIAENKARLAALGVQKHASNLTSFFKTTKPKRPWTKAPITPVECRRRSSRLKNNAPSPGFYTPSFSNKYCDDDLDYTPKLSLKKNIFRNYQDEDPLRPANAPIPKNCPADLQVSPLVSALRCRSKERGSLYDAVVGICCHFCRQKKLCGEEDCERCGQRDVTKPCLGKTDCSRCHSSAGVFCRACLKIRYGEDIEVVRQKPDWLCPHCIEEEGKDPYWICNSSICLKRRKIAPTGIAIYKVREMGYESVAHYLADTLRKQAAS